MTKFKFIDTQDRKKLNEGRQQGLGYAFCELRNDTELHTIQPISCCKDYLSDVVYSERTGKDYEAYGLKTKKLGLFDNDKPGYLVMKILPYGPQKQTTYAKMADEQTLLKKNHKKMVEFINHYEKLLNLPSITTCEELVDGTYLLVVPNFWTQYVYLISLYSLYVRNAMDWEGGLDPDEHLKRVKGEDHYYVKNSMPKMAAMIKGTIPPQDMTVYNFHPHAWGINGFQFPTS